jgi:RNA polymerase sigma-70 factor (ECF subfamily)
MAIANLPGRRVTKLAAKGSNQMVGALSHLTDEELLAASGKRPDAFGEFYLRHERTLLHYFRRRTGRADLAADLTAETFAEALRCAGRFKPGPAPALAWLLGIGAHLLARSARRGAVEDRARRRLRLPPLALDDTELAEIDDLVAGPGPLQAALETLPPTQAEAIRARVLNEQDYTEIATAMACSEAVVRQRVSRGLATLRQRLTEGAP